MISVQSPARPWQAWEKVREDPLHAAWWTAYIMTIILSMVTCSRTLATSFRPLESAGFVFVSVTAVAVCLLLRSTATRSIHALRGRGLMILAAILSLASLSLLLSLSVFGTPVSALVSGWCLFVGAEASWWTLTLQPSVPLRQSPDNTLIPEAGIQSGLAIDSGVEEPSIADEAEETWPADMTQQLSRMRIDGGGESLAGGLRADFAEGERQRTVHIAFCPPLERKPDFSVEQSEGPIAKIEVTQLENFGVRMEVKLEQAAKTNESVVLHFEAFCRSG